MTNGGTRTSRAGQGFSDTLRISLLEQDVDSIDNSVDQLRLDLNKGLNSLKTVLVSLLVSITTASVLLVLNITTTK